MAPIDIDLVRAFLNIQASSASCECLFGDASHSKGDLWQHVQESITKILLMIPKFVLSYVENAQIDGEAQFSVMSTRFMI